MGVAFTSPVRETISGVRRPVNTNSKSTLPVLGSSEGTEYNTMSGPQSLPISRSHMSTVAVISDTSNRPQNGVGICLGPHI